MKNTLHTRIDVHGHYFPPAYDAMLDRRGLTVLDGGFPRPKWSAEAQLALMERLGISFAALSISSPHLHMGDAAEAVETARACNEFGAALVKQYPDRFGLMASLPLPEADAAVREVRHCREALHADGFTLPTNSRGVYLGDARLEAVMAEMNSAPTVAVIHPTAPSAVPQGVTERMPLPFMEFFFDTTRAVLNLILSGTVQRYPNIRFVVPHAGAFLPILADRIIPMAHMLSPDGSVDVAGGLKSLYYDLAGTAMPKQYGNLLQLADKTHLLYGSDTPFTPTEMARQLADAMDERLGPDMAELVYRKNPLTLFPRLAGK